MAGVEIILVIIIVFIILYFLTPRKKHFPPGPQPWPIVGNFFQLKNPRHLTFMKWAETYGDIVGLHFGSIPIVVLNNYELIREAFSEQVFAGKPQIHFFKEWCLGGNRGLLFSDGKVWSEQRRFALKNLKSFGFGKSSMEASIMIDIRELIASFKKEVNVPFISRNRFNLAVLNALWSILSSERLSNDNPVMNGIIRTLTETLELIHRTGSEIPLIYNFKKKLPFVFTNHLGNFLTKAYVLIGDVINRHKATLQVDSPRDFVDAYLIQIQNLDNSNYIFRSSMEGDKQLGVTMLDMFVAGTETTSTTLTFSFLLLALHLNVQEKLFEEIESVVGSHREVSLSDRPKLPYLEATIMEVQRFASVIPMIRHAVTEDVRFHGYEIKKGTCVIANFYAALHDVNAWGDPENFRPERFLTDDGQNIVRHKAFIPFGFGKRICIGESLAKQELFLFMGNIFKTFKVETVKGEPKPKIETYCPIILTLKPHKLVLIERKSIDQRPSKGSDLTVGA